MPKCECCEKHAQVREGLCSACILEGFAKAIAEQDPNLVRYDAIRDEALPPEALARELAWAESEGVGWL